MASASNASRAETSSATGSSTGTGSGSNTRPAVDVTAITTRDDFLLELGEALGGQASVRPVESMAGALDYLSSAKRGQVLVIDTRDVADIRADIERAHQQAAHAVVLVFTVAETEKQVGAAVKGSNVFAVLPIPLDKRKTGAVLEGAMADAVARKSVRSPERSNAGVSVEPFQGHSDSGSPSDSDGKSKMGLIIGAGVAVVAIAAGAYFFMGKSKESTQAQAQPKTTATSAPTAPGADTTADKAPDSPAIETSIVQGKVDDLLEKARLAMRERRYSEPLGDNALLYYRSANAADPKNGEAVDGLQRVAGVLAARFDEAMNGGRFDEASTALGNFKTAAPNDSRVPTMEVRLITAQINKAMADGNLDRVNQLLRQAQNTPSISADQVNKWKAEANRRQEDAKIQRLAGLITDRIRDGRLTDPSDDSAKMYMQQLHDQSPTNATTQRLQRDLNGAYMRKARESAIANKAADVDRWLVEAKAGGISTSEITAFQKELQQARQKAITAEADRLAGLTRDRIRDGRLTDPAQDSAVFFLTQLQGVDGSSSQISSLSRDLASKLVERARVTAQKGGSGVDNDLNLAKRYGADPKDIAAVTQIQNTPKSAPASTRSAAAAGVNTASLAQSLKRTRYSPPEFPSKALSQKVNGSVTVEYTVDANGDPRDVRVIEATPPGVFDKAAITAVKKWHYDPVVVNGAPVEVPVRTSIRFELPK